MSLILLHFLVFIVLSFLYFVIDFFLLSFFHLSIFFLSLQNHLSFKSLHGLLPSTLLDFLFTCFFFMYFLHCKILILILDLFTAFFPFYSPVVSFSFHAFIFLPRDTSNSSGSFLPSFSLYKPLLLTLNLFIVSYPRLFFTCYFLSLHCIYLPFQRNI